jgi:hypothetical protein
MSKARIVKRTSAAGNITYVIQLKHWLFRWFWADAWVSSFDGLNTIDSFATLDDAKEALPRFNGSEKKDEVVG